MRKPNKLQRLSFTRGHSLQRILCYDLLLPMVANLLQDLPADEQGRRDRAAAFWRTPPVQDAVQRIANLRVHRMYYYTTINTRSHRTGLERPLVEAALEVVATRQMTYLTVENVRGWVRHHGVCTDDATLGQALELLVALGLIAKDRRPVGFYGNYTGHEAIYRAIPSRDFEGLVPSDELLMWWVIEHALRLIQCVATGTKLDGTLCWLLSTRPLAAILRSSSEEAAHV